MASTRPGTRGGETAQGAGSLLSTLPGTQPSGGARHSWVITIRGCSWAMIGTGVGWGGAAEGGEIRGRFLDKSWLRRHLARRGSSRVTGLHKGLGARRTGSVREAVCWRVSAWSCVFRALSQECGRRTLPDFSNLLWVREKRSWSRASWGWEFSLCSQLVSAFEGGDTGPPGEGHPRSL